MPREQFVDPSTGSTTTVISASSRPLHSDSSLRTRTGKAASAGRTAASAMVSRWYWPIRSVRARRSIPVSPARASRCAVAASANASRRSPGVTRLHGDDRVVVGYAGAGVAAARDGAARCPRGRTPGHCRGAGWRGAHARASNRSVTGRRHDHLRGTRARPRRSSAMKSASRDAPVSGSFAACTIVLNCLPRRVLSMKLPSGTSATAGSTGMKCAFPSGVAKLPPSQRREPPHWIASPRRVQGLDSRIRGHDARHLVADLLTGVERHEVRALRIDVPGQVDEDLPLAPRLAHLVTGDLGAERDSPLGGGLRAAVALLVAGRRRQQHDDVTRVDEHLARHDDVLVHAQRHPTERLVDELGIREHLQEVPTRRVEDVELSARRRPRSSLRR